jgi:hypothetical protein
MRKRKPKFKAYEGEWTSTRQKIYEEIMFHAEPIEEGSKHELSCLSISEETLET